MVDAKVGKSKRTAVPGGLCRQDWMRLYVMPPHSPASFPAAHHSLPAGRSRRPRQPIARQPRLLFSMLRVSAAAAAVPVQAASRAAALPPRCGGSRTVLRTYGLAAEEQVARVASSRGLVRRGAVLIGAPASG